MQTVRFDVRSALEALSSGYRRGAIDGERLARRARAIAREAGVKAGTMERDALVGAKEAE